MLVKFKSNAHANITMFGDVAVKLIKMMGHSGTVPGAILAEDVPEALDRLKKAVEADDGAAATDASSSAQDDDSSERTVSLAHRALPLIELLEASAASGCDVMWDK